MLFSAEAVNWSAFLLVKKRKWLQQPMCSEAELSVVS